MEMKQAAWSKPRGLQVSVSDSTLSHNFLLMSSQVNGLLQIALGDIKLLQVGIKSFIGFTKQVHGCGRWNFFVVTS